MVCDHCGEGSRLHPHEELVSQLLVFRRQHQHDEDPSGGAIDWAAIDQT